MTVLGIGLRTPRRYPHTQRKVEWTRGEGTEEVLRTTMNSSREHHPLNNLVPSPVDRSNILETFSITPSALALRVDKHTKLECPYL
mmetsp:Transcript_9038/g.13192  ORF Transcript_9038/g.13192 Transcript_9038/m.13192 type:complete len:86 (+) Transcript_9038:964-1221(+)